MRTAVLIANPSSSQFTGGVFREVVAILSRSFDLTTHWPVSGPDTERHARRAAEQDQSSVVFAMGGDGVAHHVANGLAGTGSSLGLIPVGTTNVLSRILDIPQRAAAAAQAATTYESVPTRVARIRGDSVAGPIDRVATFSVGVGFDAAVVEVAEQRPYAKVRFGGIHYAATAVNRLVSDFRTKAPNLRVTVDGDTFDAVATFTQVHDPYTYFGRIPLRLIEEKAEGLVTLAVGHLGVTTGAAILARAITRRSHQNRDGTHVWSAFDAMTVDAEPPAPFQADGELLGDATSIEIRPDETALRILRPDTDN